MPDLGIDLMSIILCSIDNCPLEKYCRGMCNRHYLQIQRHGKILDHTIYDARPAIIDGDIAKLPLNVNAKDGYVVVDKEFAHLDKYKWGLNKGYADTIIKGKTIKLHQLIIGKKEGMFTDHINHDRLDNRRQNLRFVTPTQNSWNSSISKRNTTGYKGVKYHKVNKNWNARIGSKHLGTYQTAIEAARAYNEAAVSIRGEYAVLNEVKD